MGLRRKEVEEGMGAWEEERRGEEEERKRKGAIKRYSGKEVEDREFGRKKEEGKKIEGKMGLLQIKKETLWKEA